MKRNYCFVRKVGHFDREDVVYHVSVGDSLKDGAQLALIQEYCKDCGFYFKRWSDGVDRTINLLSKRLFPGTSFARLFLRSAQISIDDLYRMIIDDSFENFEKSLTVKPQWATLLTNISPTFHLLNSRKICNTPCHPPRRKYLSRRAWGERQKVALAAWLILVLFLTSAYLEHIERLFY